MQNTNIDSEIEKFFGGVIYSYTSKQAEEDGFLFDVDQLINAKKMPVKPENFPIKYITTNLLGMGYWKEPCEHHIARENIGLTQTCRDCEVFKDYYSTPKAVIPCAKHEQQLNVPNILDLLTAALRIFKKKPANDWFVSGMVELPNGKKQKVFIAQNETGRYTLMLPEDY
jgi:hypothetical protein